MTEPCMICETETKVESKTCCTGAFIECGCGGGEVRVNEGYDVICKECMDKIEFLWTQGFDIKNMQTEEIITEENLEVGERP